MLAVVLFSTNILAVPLALSHLTRYKKILLKKHTCVPERGYYSFSLLIFCPDEDTLVVV